MAGDDPVPRVMGIVNVTPDSFSDGGRLGDRRGRRRRTPVRLVAEGADLLDVGGESSRPGVRAGRRSRRSCAGSSRSSRRSRPASRVPISVDTTKAEVARRALEAGASIINDITALAGDPDDGARSSPSPAPGVVLMHMQGVPRTMQDDPRYDDVVARGLRRSWPARVEAAEARGHPPRADRDRPGDRLRQDVRRTTWSSCGTSIDLPPWAVRS